MIRFETDRLLIREHRIEDLNEYHAWISDSNVMQYVIGFKQTNSIEESFIKLAEAIEGMLKIPRRKYFVAITLKDRGIYIGSGGGLIIRKEEKGGIMGIGYFLIKKYWNNGYASEATKAWIDYSFKNFDVHRIVASCDSENVSSEKIMLKCNMKKESELMQHRYQNGSWRNGLQYAIVRDDWNQK